MCWFVALALGLGAADVAVAQEIQITGPLRGASAAPRRDFDRRGTLQGALGPALGLPDGTALLVAQALFHPTPWLGCGMSIGGGLSASSLHAMPELVVVPTDARLGGLRIHPSARAGLLLSLGGGSVVPTPAIGGGVQMQLMRSPHTLHAVGVDYRATPLHEMQHVVSVSFVVVTRLGD